MCQIIKYSVYQTLPVLTFFLMCNFFLVFLYTIDGLQSNLVYCHNDTSVCSTSRLRNYFKCLWNCECYVLFYTSICLFTYFVFSGNHYNSSVGSVKSRLQNMKSQYQFPYWKVPTPELVEMVATVFIS